MDADLIVILEDGKIHAAGTHRQLLAEDPIYQEIYASQMKGDEHHAGPSAQRQKALKIWGTRCVPCCPIWDGTNTCC